MHNTSAFRGHQGIKEFTTGTRKRLVKVDTRNGGQDWSDLYNGSAVVDCSNRGEEDDDADGLT